jgi:hypothetical protein
MLTSDNDCENKNLLYTVHKKFDINRVSNKEYFLTQHFKFRILVEKFGMIGMINFLIEFIFKILYF